MKFKFGDLETQVLDDLSSHGDVYLVGGIVRDMLLYGDVDYHDVDVETYGIDLNTLEKILSRYGHVNTVGKCFGILKLDCLPNFDFALPRRESNIGVTHQDFQIDIDQNLSLQEASKRRDFTINALMYNYKTETLYDFYGGQEDIKNRVLKAVNDQTFQEDPLRVFRLAQFMSRFEMTVDEHTKTMCQEMVERGMMKHLSAERIMGEYDKLLLSFRPSLGLTFLFEIKALFHSLSCLRDCQQRLDFHPEGDVLTHTLLVVDLAALCKHKTSWPLAFMWSALLHDIGKPAVTTPQGKAPGHNQSGVAVFDDEFTNYFPNKKLRRYIRTMIFYHMHLMNMTRNHSKDYKYLLLLHGIDGIFPLNDLIYITKCDKLGRYNSRPNGVNQLDQFIAEKISRLGSTAWSPVIMGRNLIELGFTNKEQYTEILDVAYDLQLRGHTKDDIVKILKGDKRWKTS